ncbi:hypothetical protein J4443_00105 [Candidatus Woesearchaeota archaeon]|nr:hypothetical protein [Candidatus Woesearchaeota archaeon]
MNMKILFLKKGDASIVATVLLIVSAIAIALVVTTFSKESEEKVSEKIISMGSSVECADIRISIEGFNEEEGKKLTMKNRGSLGVEKAVLRVYGDTIGNEEIDFVKKNCPAGSDKFLPQETCVHNILVGVSNVYKIEIIPVIVSDEEEIGCEERISTWTG